MFGRIFGRGKDDQDQAVCAHCGRTLLAGEWTRTVVDERGDERLICSLCGQEYSGTAEPVAAAPTPANQGRVRETRSEARYEPGPAWGAEPGAEPYLGGEAPAQDDRRGARAESDAFWQALKEKDAQIEELKAQLARAEAERQELAGRFARLGAGATSAGAATAAEAAPEPGSLTGDSSEPGERTWGETPAEFAAELAALHQEGPEVEAGEFWSESATEPVAEPAPAYDAGGESPETAGLIVDAEVTGDLTPDHPAQASAGDLSAAFAAEPPEFGVEPPLAEPPVAVPPIAFEDTQPIEGPSDELPEADYDDASTGQIAAEEVAAGDGALPGEPPAVASPAEAAAAAASLTLLQRGVDLLNVSRVPHKIAETNEQLGLPHVHVGFDGQTVAVTFMWTMGWYRFHIDLESGNVTLDDRGYEERSDLPPNAGVRADGTVQLAPAQISRAAAQRVQDAPEQPARPAPEPEPAAPAGPTTEPVTPREAAQKPPEFLSKSLLGQRSDDETVPWEQTKARDFDWDR